MKLNEVRDIAVKSNVLVITLIPTLLVSAKERGR